jgi:crotonobetainyl-CoA:carnitine CoA-transferase CaiB-like acyl-CoA transferase
MGLQLLPGFPWSIAPDPPTVDYPTALLGEHNHDLLAELGYTLEDIEALEAAGVIGNAYPA